MWWTVVKEAATNWSRHKDARQGAALAYYSVFSLGPIIVIAIAVAGMLFGRDAVTSQVMSSIKEMLGDTGAKAVEAMLAEASSPSGGHYGHRPGRRSTAVRRYRRRGPTKGRSQRGLGVEEFKELGLWHFSRNYVLSFAAVLTLGFLLLVSLVVSAGLAAAGKYVDIYLPEGALHVVSILISFVVVMALFAMMFKWLPDVSIGWRDVWPGAFLTALFFRSGEGGDRLLHRKAGIGVNLRAGGFDHRCANLGLLHFADHTDGR